MLKHIPKKQNESNRDYIYRTLKQSITELYFIPGDKISEPSIAEELNVSRTPVREALILLEDENLVHIQPKQGTFVSKLDAKQIENFIFIRQCIEREVIRLAAERLTPESTEQLTEQLQAQKVFLNIKDGRTSMYLLENAFYRIVYEVAGRYEIWRSLQHMGSHFNRLRILDVLDENYTPKRYQENLTLMSILVDKKVDEIDSFIHLHLDLLSTTLPYFQKKHPDYFV